MSAADPSTTTTSTPWRVGVIGLVAVLAAGIGVAAGAFLLGARAGAIGPGASYVPAEAAFYVEMRLEPSASQDEALRQFLGAFPEIEGLDLERPLYEQMTERIDEMLSTEAHTGLRWADDVAPWFDGSVSLAVLELDVDAMTGMPMDPMTGDLPIASGAEVPPMVVMLGVTDRQAAEAAVGRMIDEAGDAAQVTQTTHAGVTVNVVAGGDEEGAWAITDDILLIAPTAADVTAALDVHGDPSASLAEAERVAAMTGELPSDWLTFISFDMTELVAASVEATASMAPEAREAFEAILQHQSLRGVAAMTAGSDRLSMEAATQAPTGPFAVENTDRGLADEIPPDALYYAEGGNIGATLAAVIGPMKDAVAATPEGAEQVEMIEAALGADLEELVSWIDDGAVAVGWDGAEPYGGMVLVPSDVDAASRRLGQLSTFASLAGLDPSSGVSVAEREVAGTTVTTIRWENASGAELDPMMPMPSGLSIEYAVTDDRALVGLGEEFVERVLTLEGASLADEARFSEAIAELGGASNAGVTWLDLTGVREAVEQAAGPMLDEMDGDGDYERDVQPWLLPLDRIVQVATLEGDVLVQRSVLLVE